MILKMFIKVTDEKFINKQIYQKLLKGLFFNSILSITLESFLEQIIYGFLNIYYRDKSTNGEILGLIFAFICIFSVFFLLNSLIWSLFFKNEIQLTSEEFQERWGALHEFLNTKKLKSRFYNLIFLVRRIIFVVICLITN